MTRTRILIADDDDDELDVLELALGAPDTYIARVSDGYALIDAVAVQGPFDLIVTDQNMPRLEGRAALEAIRTAGLDTPVLIVTGVDLLGLAADLVRLGRASMLRKPFGLAELRAAIAALLGGEP